MFTKNIVNTPPTEYKQLLNVSIYHAVHLGTSLTFKSCCLFLKGGSVRKEMLAETTCCKLTSQLPVTTPQCTMTTTATLIALGLLAVHLHTIKPAFYHLYVLNYSQYIQMIHTYPFPKCPRAVFIPLYIIFLKFL